VFAVRTFSSSFSRRLELNQRAFIKLRVVALANIRQQGRGLQRMYRGRYTEYIGVATFSTVDDRAEVAKRV
jgi:hypothetical protein